MHSLWGGWEEQVTFYQKKKTWLEVKFKKDLCFVAFVYADITGVW
jgi:hypothetical protein